MLKTLENMPKTQQNVIKIPYTNLKNLSFFPVTSNSEIFQMSLNNS
jgi:hypothetical protein